MLLLSFWYKPASTLCTVVGLLTSSPSPPPAASRLTGDACKVALVRLAFDDKAPPALAARQLSVFGATPEQVDADTVVIDAFRCNLRRRSFTADILHGHSDFDFKPGEGIVQTQYETRFHFEGVLERSRSADGWDAKVAASWFRAREVEP